MLASKGTRGTVSLQHSETLPTNRKLSWKASTPAAAALLHVDVRRHTSNFGALRLTRRCKRRLGDGEGLVCVDKGEICVADDATTLVSARILHFVEAANAVHDADHRAVSIRKRSYSV